MYSRSQNYLAGIYISEWKRGFDEYKDDECDLAPSLAQFKARNPLAHNSSSSEITKLYKARISIGYQIVREMFVGPHSGEILVPIRKV